MKSGKSSSKKVKDLTIEVEKSIDKWNGVADDYNGFVKSKDNEKPIWWISMIVIVVFFALIIYEYTLLNQFPTSENHDSKIPSFAPNARSLTVINIILFILSIYTFYSISKFFNETVDMNIYYLINLIMLCSVQYFFAYSLRKAHNFSPQSEKRYRPASMALLVWALFVIFDIARISGKHHRLLIFKIVELIIVLLEFSFLYFYEDAQTIPFMTT